jgi:hypothetical protein
MKNNYAEEKLFFLMFSVTFLEMAGTYIAVDETESLYTLCEL